MINPHLSYIIPFTGLGEGIHDYKFHVDSDFFAAIDDALVTSGDVQASLRFDKRPSMMIMDFEYEGVLDVVCDRCADDFQQKIAGKSEYIVKFAAKNYEEEDIIYIQRSEINLNVAHYLYESMILELPLRNIHPEGQCNTDVVRNIAGESELAANTETEIDEKPIDENNPFAKAFGKLNGN